jgi:hypothetical protein
MHVCCHPLAEGAELCTCGRQPRESWADGALVRLCPSCHLDVARCDCAQFFTQVRDTLVEKGVSY